MYGAKSPERCPSNVAYATPRPAPDATTRLTKVPFGTPVTFRDTSVHVAPPSRETWMLPSSAPTHRMSASSGDSLIVVNSLYDDSPSFLESMGSLPSTP